MISIFELSNVLFLFISWQGVKKINGKYFAYVIDQLDKKKLREKAWFVKKKFFRQDNAPPYKGSFAMGELRDLLPLIIIYSQMCGRKHFGPNEEVLVAVKGYFEDFIWLFQKRLIERIGLK